MAVYANMRTPGADATPRPYGVAASSVRRETFTLHALLVDQEGVMRVGMISWEALSAVGMLRTAAPATSIATTSVFSFFIVLINLVRQ